MRRGTEELNGVTGPVALLSGRTGASVSVGMATRRLEWSAVVTVGDGGVERGRGHKRTPET